MNTNNNSTFTPEFFLGIDVGKPDLFCHLLGPNEAVARRFDNSDRGIAELIAWLESFTPPIALTACLEQTGHYGFKIANALHKHQIHSLFLVNPRQIKAFGQQKLRRNKSDTADAKLIARFLQSEHTELRAWEPKSIENERITELNRYAETIVREVSKLKTKSQAAREPAIQRSLKRRIKLAEKEITDIRARITKIINSKTNLKDDYELIASIPGMGDITCLIMIAELTPIADFHSARELAAWTGLTPGHHSSGSSGRTSTPITKIGSANLRRALFMPAMNARVFNPLLKEFADRLQENGKKPKQIIIAIMRKLIHQIYGILKSKEPYNPEKRGLINPANA